MKNKGDKVEVVGRAAECENCAELEKKIEDMYSWSGLMRILDKVYPEWMFTSDGVKITEENYTNVGDIGAVVVKMIRLLDGAEKHIAELETENAELRAKFKIFLEAIEIQHPDAFIADSVEKIEILGLMVRAGLRGYSRAPELEKENFAQSDLINQLESQIESLKRKAVGKSTRGK